MNEIELLQAQVNDLMVNLNSLSLRYDELYNHYQYKMHELEKINEEVKNRLTALDYFINQKIDKLEFEQFKQELKKINRPKFNLDKFD